MLVHQHCITGPQAKWIIPCANKAWAFFLAEMAELLWKLCACPAFQCHLPLSKSTRQWCR